MKKLFLPLSILGFTLPVLAAPNSVQGTQQDLVKELLQYYAGCTNAGKPNVDGPGHNSDKPVVVYVCKRDGNGAFGGIDILTYEESSVAENGNSASWTKLD